MPDDVFRDVNFREGDQDVTTAERILCLANSRKLHGRCIAGIEISADGRRHGWIRPVSERESQEVSEHERQYPDGSDPRVLDIMDVALLGPRPSGCQQENWLLDRGRYWEKAARARPVDLDGMLDPLAPLWIDGYNTYNGLNDHIPMSELDTVESSLRLLRTDMLTLHVFQPGAAFGNARRRVQGRFRHHGTEYWLWVTDPKYEQKYLRKCDGLYKLGPRYLVISLGERYRNEIYKLIATVIRCRKAGPA